MQVPVLESPLALPPPPPRAGPGIKVWSMHCMSLPRRQQDIIFWQLCVASL